MRNSTRWGLNSGSYRLADLSLACWPVRIGQPPCALMIRNRLFKVGQPQKPLRRSEQWQESPWQNLHFDNCCPKLAGSCGGWCLPVRWCWGGFAYKIRVCVLLEAAWPEDPYVSMPEVDHAWRFRGIGCSYRNGIFGEFVESKWRKERHWLGKHTV